MANTKRTALAKARAQKLTEAMEILRTLGFAARQSNEVAGYTLLALLDLKPTQPWNSVSAPLRGITPIIEFVGAADEQRKNGLSSRATCAQTVPLL